MNARFYAPQTLTSGATIDLPDEEAQHATRVLRLGAGASVHVFDGRGHEHSATIVDVGKRGVRVEIGNATEPAVEATLAVTLVQAVLKGDKMDDVVRDAVMMGVAAIQPIVSVRTEVPLSALARGRRERWERVAISSAKQCGRAIVPSIAPPTRLETLSTRPDEPVLMCVEPSLGYDARPISALPQPAPQAVRLLVGPEGGWTSAEVARLAPSASLVTLGGRTLRADAVALVALSAIYVQWGDL